MSKCFSLWPSLLLRDLEVVAFLSNYYFSEDFPFLAVNLALTKMFPLQTSSGPGVR